MAEAKNPVEKPQAASIIKYKVEVTCYWDDLLYRENDIVELPANVTPPKEYFTKL